MNKITIIGAGKVGSTIAYTLSVMNLAKDIVMIDINHELALGEALDIRQGTPFSSNCSVYAGDYPDAANSNIVVITSGVARKPGQSRLELAQTNVNIMKSIMPQVTKYAPDAMYIIVSNPVDILTYQWCKRSGPSTTTSARATFTPTCSASTAIPLSCRGVWPTSPTFPSRNSATR